MPSEPQNQKLKNIFPANPGTPIWNSADLNGSLQAVLMYVESEAAKSIKWYWDHKGSKAFWSQVIRFAAFTLTALGGLFPIAVIMLDPLLPGKYQIPDKGLVSSLFVGVAAGLYGIDKAFGISSGWTRYVLTATLIEKSLEEFRLQWALLLARLNQTPQLDQIEALLKCAQDFRLAVSSAVLQETKDWATEFQNNLGELERETRSQLEILRAKVEKFKQEDVQANRPGALELTVTDAPAADGFEFAVKLEGEREFVQHETLKNTKTWSTLGLAPGQYRLTLSGKIGGKDTLSTKIIIIKADEVAAIEAKLQV